MSKKKDNGCYEWGNKAARRIIIGGLIAVFIDACVFILSAIMGGF